jgi:hypothetical protein
MASRATARPMRIVAVNVRGRRARVADLEQRCALLMTVVDQMARARWADIDVVLLPAGYFRLRLQLGPLAVADRNDALDRSVIAAACRRAARRLQRCCGAKLVIGIDTADLDLEHQGDQLMVLWGETGVLASARKIFPSFGDTSGKDRPPLLLYPWDYTSPGRRALIGGREMLLAVCYDAFVFSEMANGPTQKRKAMRYLFDPEDAVVRLTDAGRAELLAELRGFRRSPPAAALVGVHGFKRPGRELYWQRHGIATTSAALRGALVVGAAHYRRLTWKPEATSAVLAARAVPGVHLRQGLHRKAHRLAPVAIVRAQVKNKKKLSAVLQLFEG